MVGESGAQLVESGCDLDGAPPATVMRRLTRGDGPYAVWRIGLASGLPPLARCGPSLGFPCQIPPRPWNFSVDCGPEVFHFRASRPVLAPP
jgi:hypothetical protein